MVGWENFWLLERPLGQDDQRKVVHTTQATTVVPSFAFQNHDSGRIWLDECPSLDQSSQNTSLLSITLHSIFQLTLNSALTTLHLTFQYTSNHISHFRFTFQLQVHDKHCHLASLAGRISGHHNHSTYLLTPPFRIPSLFRPLRTVPKG